MDIQTALMLMAAAVAFVTLLTTTFLITVNDLDEQDKYYNPSDPESEAYWF